jgi:hypothetical protein
MNATHKRGTSDERAMNARFKREENDERKMNARLRLDERKTLHVLNARKTMNAR